MSTVLVVNDGRLRIGLFALALIAGADAWPAAASELHELVIPDVHYPALPAAAANAEGFVPAGWRIEAKAEGDLDGGGAADLALVLRAQDPANIVANDSGWCEQAFDTNPRILAIAFAVTGGGYRLAVQNHALIPRRDNPCQVDWFGDGSLEVKRGTLRLYFEHMMSAGGWDAGTTTIRLRWQDRALRLIGYDFSNVQRNSGRMSLLSINYLTRRVKTTTGNVSVEAEKIRWTRLPARPLLTIDQIGDGMQFDPDGLVSSLP
jgi:hypothetical protein